MRAGWFTPTEASVVAVFYARSAASSSTGHWNGRRYPTSCARSALLTASVLIIIGLSAAFAWILTIEGVPQTLAELADRA